VVITASSNAAAAATVPKKAVPPVPVRQSSIPENAGACLVSKKLHVKLFKGDSLKRSYKTKIHFLLTILSLILSFFDRA